MSIFYRPLCVFFSLPFRWQQRRIFSISSLGSARKCFLPRSATVSFGRGGVFLQGNHTRIPALFVKRSIYVRPPPAVRSNLVYCSTSTSRVTSSSRASPSEYRTGHHVTTARRVSGVVEANLVPMVSTIWPKDSSGIIVFGRVRNSTSMTLWHTWEKPLQFHRAYKRLRKHETIVSPKVIPCAFLP